MRCGGSSGGVRRRRQTTARSCVRASSRARAGGLWRVVLDHAAPDQRGRWGFGGRWGRAGRGRRGRRAATLRGAKKAECSLSRPSPALHCSSHPRPLTDAGGHYGRDRAPPAPRRAIDGGGGTGERAGAREHRLLLLPLLLLLLLSSRARATTDEQSGPTAQLHRTLRTAAGAAATFFLGACGVFIEEEGGRNGGWREGGLFSGARRARRRSIRRGQQGREPTNERRTCEHGSPFCLDVFKGGKRREAGVRARGQGEKRGRGGQRRWAIAGGSVDCLVCLTLPNSRRPHAHQFDP